jgi:hypothetical protein
MTAVRSRIKDENAEGIFIGKTGIPGSSLFHVKIPEIFSTENKSYSKDSSHLI